jgi:hypothetical protein
VTYTYVFLYVCVKKLSLTGVWACSVMVLCGVRMVSVFTFFAAARQHCLLALACVLCTAQGVFCVMCVLYEIVSYMMSCICKGNHFIFPSGLQFTHFQLPPVRNRLSWCMPLPSKCTIMLHFTHVLWKSHFSLSNLSLYVFRRCDLNVTKFASQLSVSTA